MVKAMKDKPILFLAIAANVTLPEAAAYQKETGMAMLVYPDNLALMQKRYGQQISLQNIHQTRVLDPNGKIIGNDMSKEALEKALGQVKVEWKYKSQGYDPKLEAAMDAFEWGQFAQGMKLLAPFRKSTNKALAESANKLFDEVKKEGEKWKSDAEQAAESEPVKAYDLYSKVTTTFIGAELAKSVADPLKKLAANKAVSTELAARKAFSVFLAGEGKLTPAQKPLGAKTCQDIAKKYAGTPTGDKASALADELGK
ncbi:MAG TPA: hypothetical protein VJY33_23540 [Isosphaeraceae bacterium]|nr:hypothetical protein [Isosphaeraceae bacterium]